VAVLPDGRVVIGDSQGRMLVWDPFAPQTALVEVGRNRDGTEEVGVIAVGVLPDGRVVSGDMDGRLLVWDLQTHASRVLLRFSARSRLVTAVLSSGRGVLVAVDIDGGLSTYTLPGAQESRRPT
jgi:WD40 repeat protein